MDSYPRNHFYIIFAMVLKIKIILFYLIILFFYCYYLVFKAYCYV